MALNHRQLLDRAEQLMPKLVEWRRTLHRWPELGFQENKTAAYISSVLREIGFEVTEGIGKTGVVGLLPAESEGRTVALRADMDALPITEETGLSFASENRGVMHACGHDGHMAAVLGACLLLKEFQNELAGGVKAIFQPAEEMLGGGRVLCEEGVLENPDVSSIYGLHLWPWLPFGEVGLVSGAMMAAFDEFEIEIIGQSSHGASPHMGTDAIVTAARVIDTLQHVVARQTDPQMPAVVTIGKIHGGTATNIIADSVTLAGGVRTFDPKLRQEMPGRMEKIVRGVTSAHAADYNFTWKEGYPALVTDEAAVQHYVRAADHVFGADAVKTDIQPSMASEDFAYYLQRISGAYAFIGIGEPGGSPGLHTPKFDFDERILPKAAAVLAAVTLESLADNG